MTNMYAVNDPKGEHHGRIVLSTQLPHEMRETFSLPVVFVGQADASVLDMAAIFASEYPIVWNEK